MWCASARFKRRLGLWLIIALFGHFGLGPGEGSAWVLCFGADGHVAVEPRGHDHRLQPVRAAGGVSIRDDASPVLNSGENPCIDIPVVSEDHGAHKPAIESRQPSLDAKLVALLPFVFASIPFGEPAAGAVFFPDPPIVDFRLSALRTVVLLI